MGQHAAGDAAVWTRRIKELQPGLPGRHSSTPTSSAPRISSTSSIDNLTRALLIGALLVILVLFAFLFEWRTALISAHRDPTVAECSRPRALRRGDTINVMVLAGLVISLGVVVDDAIIDIENIWRRLRQHRREGGDARREGHRRGVARGAELDRLRDA